MVQRPHQVTYVIELFLEFLLQYRAVDKEEVLTIIFVQ